MKESSPRDDAAPPEEATRTRLKRKYEAALRLSTEDPEGAAEALRELLPQCEGSARVHFLVLSNLARLAAREDQSESLRLLLEAGLLQSREGKVSAAVLLRIALAASRIGDGWTSHWALLHYAHNGGLPCAAVFAICDSQRVPQFEGAVPPLRRPSRLEALSPLRPVTSDEAAPPYRTPVAPVGGRGSGPVPRSSRPSRGRHPSRRLLSVRDHEATFSERVLVRR